MITPKKYDLNTFTGLSQKQLDEHYKLYLGYIQKTNELSELSKGCELSNDKEQCTNVNTTYSPFRCIKLGETYALNGVILHELYFENVTGSPEEKKMISKNLMNSIVNQYKNLNNLINNLRNVGLSMRGWAILAYDNMNKCLKIFGSDAHDVGAIWSVATPLIVLDVYEHAYFMDFGTDRKSYIDIFIKNINWSIISKRYSNIIRVP